MADPVKGPRQLYAAGKLSWAKDLLHACPWQKIQLTHTLTHIKQEDVSCEEIFAVSADVVWDSKPVGKVKGWQRGVLKAFFV